MNYKIEAFRNISNKFFWHLKSKNKKILASSEIYTRKEMCLKTAKKLAKDLKCDWSFRDITKDWEE